MIVWQGTATPPEGLIADRWTSWILGSKQENTGPGVMSSGMKRRRNGPAAER